MHGKRNILQTHFMLQGKHKKILLMQLLCKQSLTCQQLKLGNISQGWSLWRSSFTINMYLIFWKTNSWNECTIMTVSWVYIILKIFQKKRRMRLTYPTIFPNKSKGKVMCYSSVTHYLYFHDAEMVTSKFDTSQNQKGALKKNLEINKQKRDL